MASGKTDERGWSLADCLNRVDEGGAAGPAMPGGAAGGKAAACRRKRLKESYSLVTIHELDVDHRSHMAQNHFQRARRMGLPDRHHAVKRDGSAAPAGPVAWSCPDGG